MGICWFAWLQSRALFRKTKPRRAQRLPRDSHHQPILVLLSADSSCGAELMEVGKKSQGPNKEPFRCSIQNIKEQRVSVPSPVGPSSIWMKGVRWFHNHPVKLFVETQLEERPITHGPHAQPAQNHSLREKSSLHFAQFPFKIWVLPRILLISNTLCSWVLVFFPCFSKKKGGL